jgi:hypothetical protein
MNFIHHLKEVYPKSSCEKMIEIFDQNSPFAVRGTAGKEYLDDLELTLEITDADCYSGLGAAVYKAVDEYKIVYPLINTHISNWKVNPYCQLMRYEPNNYYSRIHCENDGTPEFSTRVFAWMIYLNDIREGGGTHFVYQNFTAQPVAGDLYIWPAHWTHFHHGVNAPYEKKYIITGWVDYVL